MPGTNNHTIIAGKVLSNPETVSKRENSPLKTLVCVMRRSETPDTILLHIPPQLLAECPVKEGDAVIAEGPVRVYRNRETGQVTTYVFAKSLNVVAEEELEYKNDVFITGKLVKAPVARETFKGTRITDLRIAVSRTPTNADRINCICWNQAAERAKDFKEGDTILIRGRLQSRSFMRKSKDGKVHEVTVHEVSAALVRDLSNRKKPKKKKEE